MRRPRAVNTLNVTTTSDSSGNLIPNGTYQSAIILSRLRSARCRLKPEESDAYTVGLVWDAAGPTSVTLDFYHIEIDDRVALLTNTIGPTEVALLTAAGIPNAALLNGSNANFFVNGFDSEIEGIDLALTSGFDLAGGDLVADLRYNYNTQEVTDVAPGTINNARVYDLENQIPENRAVLSFNWASGGMFGALLRFNYYDSWSTTSGLLVRRRREETRSCTTTVRACSSTPRSA